MVESENYQPHRHINKSTTDWNSYAYWTIVDDNKKNDIHQCYLSIIDVGGRRWQHQIEENWWPK